MRADYTARSTIGQKLNIFITHRNENENKKAELPQRWPRDAPYGCPENFRESL